MLSLSLHFGEELSQKFRLNYDQVQSDVCKYKFAPALALKWYPKNLIGQAKLFDISAANQN